MTGPIANRVSTARVIPTRSAGEAQWFDGTAAPCPITSKPKRIFSHFRAGQLRAGAAQPLSTGRAGILCAEGRSRPGCAFATICWGLIILSSAISTPTPTPAFRRLPRTAPPNWTRSKSDATLAALHAQAVTWRKDRFIQLLQQEPFRALFGRLLMTPPTQPLTPKRRNFWSITRKLAQQHKRE